MYTSKCSAKKTTAYIIPNGMSNTKNRKRERTCDCNACDARQGEYDNDMAGNCGKHYETSNMMYIIITLNAMHLNCIAER